jgi:hypothetical protein
MEVAQLFVPIFGIVQAVQENEMFGRKEPAR